MLEKWAARYREWGQLPLRLAVGIIFFGHGAQKLFGAFGGQGIDATTMFVGSLGFAPAIFWAYLLALTEFLGGILVFFGFLTGLASIGLATSMTVAILKVHLPNGLLGKGGFEYPLVLLAATIALMLGGPGKLSVSGLFRKK